MIIYEANGLVDDDIASEFKAWLLLRVVQVLQFEGFIHGEILQLLQDQKLQKSQRCTGFSVRYEVDSIESLDHYLEHHAPAMRGNGNKRFGTKFSAYRRVLSERVTLKARDQACQEGWLRSAVVAGGYYMATVVILFCHHIYPGEGSVGGEQSLNKLVWLQQEPLTVV